MTGGHPDFSDPGFWDRLVQAGPAVALGTIASVLRDGEVDGDARALAHGAAARCHYELGDLDSASASARDALDAARSPAVNSAVVLGVSAVLAECGQVDDALERLQRLAAETEGVDLGRLRLQVAYVLVQAGRLNEALQEFGRCEALFGHGGAAREWVRLHLNRGLVLLQQGQIDRARSDFDRALTIAEEHGFLVMAAQAVANLAVLHGRARRLPLAVREFDRAAGMFELVGNPDRTVAHMELDRAEVLMHSGLVADAVGASRAALRFVEHIRNPVLVGDAWLMVARTELAAGLDRDAIASAQHAERVFAESGRTDMISHARSVAVRAGLLRARTGAELEPLLADAVDVVRALRSSGWSDQADELSAARIRAARRGRLLRVVRGDLERLQLGLTHGRRDTALAGWWARAVALEANGENRAASEACHAGLDILDVVVAEAPSLGRRSAAMRMGADLSQLLIELAVDAGDAETAFGAAEGTRARSLHDELAESSRHQRLTRSGATALCADLVDRLNARSLVEWIVVRDEVWAVVLDRDGSRLVRVGAYGEIVLARDRLVVWLDRAADDPDDSSERARRVAGLLDELLIAPLDLPDDEGVVLVPVDLLHGIPWAGLPSLAGRPMVLAPNAQVWLGADRRAVGVDAGVGVVIGPGVERSEVERDAVERLYADVEVAGGADATGSAVASMLSVKGIVHVAAHGTFRSDYPLLSALRLVDGEVTLHDAVPPRVRSQLVILSSCEGGAQGTADGSEVLGLSSVLLARGAAGVLAPLTVVRELECAEFVAEVHAELVGGEPFACAVAAVRRRWLAENDLSRWAVASSFTCFGSGAVRVGG